MQYFVKKGVPVLGIEPAANVAEVAEGKGIPTTGPLLRRDAAKELVSQGPLRTCCSETTCCPMSRICTISSAA